MNDYNHCVLIGRATDDIKIIKGENFIKYTFVLALNYYSKKKKVSYCDFIPICFWKKDPHKVLGNVKKGDVVFLDGRITIHSFMYQEQKRWKAEVVGKSVRLSKTENGSSKDMKALLVAIKSNKQLIEEITKSSDVNLSDELLAELLS